MDKYTQAIEQLEKSKDEFFSELYMAQPILNQVLGTKDSKGSTYDIQCRASELLEIFKSLCDHHFNIRKDAFIYCKCGERIRARMPATPASHSEDDNNAKRRRLL